MSDGHLITLARIQRPRGRRGEVLAECLCEGPERLLNAKVFLVGRGTSTEASVEEAWWHQERLVLKFNGFESIDAAESLRGFEVCVPLSERVPAAEGEYYLDDLVGCQLVDQRSNRPLGEVTGWQKIPGGYLLESGTLLIPFARSICTQIDIAARTIRVDLPEGLDTLNVS